MGKITSSKDLLMLLLYAKGCKGEQCEPVVGRTRLMKMIFIFNKEIRGKFSLDKKIPDDAMPDFEPFHYGPYSRQVFDDLEFLVDMGFVIVIPAEDEDRLSEENEEYEYWQVQADPDQEGVGQSQERFQLSELGREFVEEELLAALSPDQLKALDEFKYRCTAAELRALLYYVYTKYPEMTDVSRIRDEVLKY